MSALIEARGLTRILPAAVPVTLVQDVSLTVAEREFVALTGPSGSGKSSLLYLLGLLDRPTSGALSIRGRDTEAMGEAERSELRLTAIGFVFQFHFLLPEFTVRENVEIPMRKLGRLSRRAMRDRAGALLESLAWSATSRSTPTSSRAASASEWRWRGRSPTIRRLCWPTSRPGASTRRAQSRSLPSCRRWYASAARRSSP